MTRWSVGVVTMAILGGAGLWVSDIQSEAAQGETTRQRVTVLELERKNDIERMESMREWIGKRLDKIENKLDGMAAEKRRH